MVPLLFTAASRIRPHQVLYCCRRASWQKLLSQEIFLLQTQYPAAVTGGTCRSLTAVRGSVRCSVSHVPSFSVRPSQPASLPFGPLCKTSRDVLSSSTLLFFSLTHCGRIVKRIRRSGYLQYPVPISTTFRNGSPFRKCSRFSAKISQICASVSGRE